MTRVSNIKCTKRFALTCIVCTLGTSVPTGYHLSVINNPAEYIQSWCNHTLINQYNVHISDEVLRILWASVVSIFLIGGALGSVIGSWSSDKYGRKIPLLIIGVLFCLGALCFLSCRLCKSIELLLLGRLLVGLASGICTTTVPMYLTEISPLHFRGPIGAFFAIGVCLGIPLAQVASMENVIGSERLWHLSLSAHAIFALLCLLPYPLFPESPMYLYVIKRDVQGSRKALMKLRGKNCKSIDKDISSMEEEVKHRSKARTIWSVLTDPAYLLPVILVSALQSGQQFSGVNIVFYYSIIIYKSAGLSLEAASYVNLGAGILIVVTACITPFLMGKVNRRPLIIWSCISCGVCLLILLVSLYLTNSATYMGIISSAVIYAFLLAFGCGFDPIPYFIASELFESGPRPAAMAIGSIVSWTSNFLVGFSFPSLHAAWGAFVFLPYAVFCLGLAVLLYYYLPETRGVCPSTVAPLISNGFRSRPMAKMTLVPTTDDLKMNGEL